MKKKRIAIAACCLVGLIAIYVLYIVSIAGEFKTLKPQVSHSCKSVPGVTGPEDMVLLTDESGLFMTSNDHRSFSNGGPSNGAVYFYDLAGTEPPVNVTPPELRNDTFRPHGIGLFSDGKKTSIFVVNHPGGDLRGDLKDAASPKHTIEILDVVGRKLTHRRTVSGPLLNTPNDVAPVGFDQFYVSNDHGSGDRFIRKLEDYGRLSRANLLYFDGATFQKLPATYRYANGMATSRDYKEVYVAATTDREVIVLKRQPDNRLVESQRIFLGSAPDNLFVDEAGDIWVASHPKLLTMAGYMSGDRQLSPSQVFELVRDDGFRPIERYLNHGDALSASTAAIGLRDRLLISGLMSDGFLDCYRVAQ